MRREKAGKQMRRREQQDILKSSVLCKEIGLFELTNLGVLTYPPKRHHRTSLSHTNVMLQEDNG